MARDHGQQPRHILRRRAHRAAMIDRIGDRHRAVVGTSPGRLQAIDPTPARRRSDRATLVAAERHRHGAGGDESRAAAGGSSRTVLGVMGIEDRTRGAGMARPGKAQILARRLAGDRPASLQDTGHDRRIDLGDISFEQLRAVHHRHAGHADIVLDGDRLARQQTGGRALDLRLPVPGVVGIFLGRWPVPGRARVFHRQLGLHQPVQPCAGSDRPAHQLAEGHQVVFAERESERVRNIPELFDGRKPHRHRLSSPQRRLIGCAKQKRPDGSLRNLQALLPSRLDQPRMFVVSGGLPAPHRPCRAMMDAIVLRVCGFSIRNQILLSAVTPVNTPLSASNAS